MPPDVSEITALYQQAAGEDREAADFLGAVNAYFNGWDDLADDPESSFAAKMRLGILASVLFSCPFYQRHTGALRLVVFLVTNAFAESVEWANRPEAWRREAARVLRYAGNDMVLAVAYITSNGNYDFCHKLSEQLRACSVKAHEHH